MYINVLCQRMDKSCNTNMAIYQNLFCTNLSCAISKIKDNNVWVLKKMHVHGKHELTFYSFS